MKYKVPTKGRIPFLVIYIGIIAFIVFAFAMRTSNKYGGELIEMFITTLGVGFPLILPAILLPSYWILRKKVPLEVVIDSNHIQLIYSKKRIKKYSKSKVAYSVHHYRYHSVIVLYSKLKATRGHLLYNAFADIVATEIPFSWNPEKLRKIDAELLEYDFERRQIEDSKLFVLRIIG